MSLHEKPHAVTVEITDMEALPEGWAASPSGTVSVPLTVQMTPKTAEQAFREFGVEGINGMKMMGDLEDEWVFHVHGSKVIWSVNGRERIYRIATPARVHAQGDDCDHVSVMLGEVRTN